LFEENSGLCCALTELLLTVVCNLNLTRIKRAENLAIDCDVLQANVKFTAYVDHTRFVYSRVFLA